MKKLLILLIPCLFISMLSATHLTPVETKGGLELTYGGDFATRAIMNNDDMEKDGGWMDNRLRFELYAKLGEKFGLAWKPQVGYNLFTGFGCGGGIMTRELYFDYSMDFLETTMRVGRHYWNDHRSIILDDYFPGISADMKIAGFDAEAGFVKANEGMINQLDDQHAGFFNIMGEAPIKWGAMLMFGQNHSNKTADIWIEPYAGLEFAPLKLDLTAIINDQMFKDAAGKDDSEMGIGIAVKADADLGVKVGADVMYVTEEGIDTLSPYYDNGLYMFGNKLPFDGVQLVGTGYNGGQAYMSMVLNGSFPFSDNMEFFGAAGMVSVDDPIGTELDLGVNYQLMDNVKCTGVLGVGQTGKAIDADENMVYMVGGLVTVEY